MRTLSLLLIVAVWSPLSAQEAAAPKAPRNRSAADHAAAAVNGRVMQAHLEFLADDLLEGRAPGTRGGDIAALYIAKQFMRLGLEPADEVLPTFRYDGAEQAMRVVLRVALAVADAPARPSWSPESEFREAGAKRIAR